MSIKITVRHGANSWPLENIDNGLTVKQLFNDFKTPFNLPDKSDPKINGDKVDWNQEVHNGDSITFEKRSGTKG